MQGRLTQDGEDPTWLILNFSGAIVLERCDVQCEE